MKFEKIKEWIKTHKIKNLVKLCVLSTLVVYFVLSILTVFPIFSYYNWITESPKHFEENLSDTQNNAMYGNYKQYSLNEFIVKLKFIDYLDNHENVSKLSLEEQSDLTIKIIHFIEEHNTTISEFKSSITQKDLDNINNDNSDYTIETVIEILDLLEISRDIPFFETYLSELREDLNNSNYTARELLEFIENDKLDVLLEFFIKDENENDYNNYYYDKYDYYCIKYPFSMYNFEENSYILYNEISNIVYSLFIGIFIGVIIFAYSNTKNIKRFILIDILLLIFVFVIENLLHNEILFSLNYDNTIFVTGGNFYVPFFKSVTALITFLCVLLCIFKIIINKRTINDLNKFCNTDEK